MRVSARAHVLGMVLTPGCLCLCLAGRGFPLFDQRLHWPEAEASGEAAPPSSRPAAPTPGMRAVITAGRSPFLPPPSLGLYACMHAVMSAVFAAGWLRPGLACLQRAQQRQRLRLRCFVAGVRCRTRAAKGALGPRELPDMHARMPGGSTGRGVEGAEPRWAYACKDDRRCCTGWPRLPDVL